jgi:hypothetical protein
VVSITRLFSRFNPFVEHLFADFLTEWKEKGYGQHTCGICSGLYAQQAHSGLEQA